MPKLIASTLVLLSLAVVRTAMAADPGPAVGDHFPHTLRAPDQAGHERDLASLMGTNGLAVFFVRSADWCPFCKGQLVDVNRHLEAFTALGVNVVSVSVDEVPLIAAFFAEQSIGYTMLADPKGDINLALGIRDEQYPVGSAQFGVPRPVLYVLDRAGTIRLRYMEPTYRTRPNLDMVLDDVSALDLASVPVVDVNAQRETTSTVVCREEQSTGSHFRRKRCLTNGEREEIRRNAQEALRSNGREGSVLVER
jgi:peroxiredoxin